MEISCLLSTGVTYQNQISRNQLTASFVSILSRLFINSELCSVRNKYAHQISYINYIWHIFQEHIWGMYMYQYWPCKQNCCVHILQTTSHVIAKCVFHIANNRAHTVLILYRHTDTTVMLVCAKTQQTVTSSSHFLTFMCHTQICLQNYTDMLYMPDIWQTYEGVHASMYHIWCH